MNKVYNLSHKKKIAANPKMNFWEKIYIVAIFKGMWITLKHFFMRKATIQYPEEKREMSQIYRGHHVLKRDENGAERCTACGLCALACPAEAITMTAAERKSDEHHLYREEKYAAIYEINMLRCIYCGLCESACPKEAIFLTDKIVDTEYLRGEFIYGKDKLVEPIEADKRIDVTKRQTPEVIEFKKIPNEKHNELYPQK